VIEPNRLSIPGEVAARERVEAVCSHIDELSGLDLANLVVAPRDPEEREVLLADLEQAADARGLGELLDEARNTVRDARSRACPRTFRPGPTRSASRRPRGRRPREPAGGDRGRRGGRVAQDVVEPEVAVELAEPGRSILGLPPLDLAGALAPESTPVADPPWAPTARDWAEADRGVTVVEPGEPLPGQRGVRILVFGVFAVVGVAAALAWGFTEGEPWLGVLAAIAVVAVAWTLATLRRAR
jgi:hypothetical protein